MERRRDSAPDGPIDRQLENLASEEPRVTKRLDRTSSTAPAEFRGAGTLQTRRDFLAQAALGAPAVFAVVPVLSAVKAETVKIRSPNGTIQLTVVRDVPYSAIVLLFRARILLNIQLRIVIDGVDLGQDIEIESVQRYQQNDTYATRGVHSVAQDHCRGARISISHPASQTKYVIDVRAYDDGVAFRYVVPGDGRRVPEDLTIFRPSEFATVWFHDFEGHYEGVHQKKDVWKIEDGQWLAPLMIYGAHPQHILDNPARDLIKTIPAVWDETIVLPHSKIGELAAFARRNGNVWFVGILNALTGKTIRIPLSFLAPKMYRATLLRDEIDDPAAMKIENSSVGRAQSMTIRMRAGGGFVARFQPLGAGEYIHVVPRSQMNRLEAQ